MPPQLKGKKSTSKSLSESDVQQRLYGNIDAKLKSIKKEIEETAKKVYRLKKNRYFYFKTIFLYAAITLVAVSAVKGYRIIAGRHNQAIRSAAAISQTAKYTIQVALYKNNNDAEVFNKLLNLKGYPAFVNFYQSQKGVTMHRVCVGKINNKNEALILLEKLRKEEGAGDSFLINLK